MLGVLALLLLNACATAPGTDASQDSALTLERMQQAAVDFARARDAGDALGMARAAAARQPFDVLASGTTMLTSATMFEDARRLAAGNTELLAKIGELESGRAGPLRNLSGLTGQSLARAFAGRNVPFTVVDGAGALRGQQFDELPVPPGDCGSQSFGPSPGRVLTIGARSSLVLCGAVRDRRTLYVYVEGGLDRRLMLRVLDLATTELICEHTRPNPLCKWPPPAKATRAMVQIGNPGGSEVSVTLIAHQE